MLADEPKGQKFQQEAKWGAASARTGNAGLSRAGSSLQRQLAASGPETESRGGGGSPAHDDSALLGQAASSGSSRQSQVYLTHHSPDGGLLPATSSAETHGRLDIPALRMS